MSARAFLPALFLSLAALHADEPAKPESTAKEQPLPGHSMNGDVFNEGPRQAAVLIPGSGDVHLAVTTSNELAQKFFDQGVGQLHGFWYFEAERSFRQVAALDANCAMAYWGMAMANINNPKRAGDFIKQGVKIRDKASRREQLYIDGLASFYAETKKDESTRREALVRALEELSDEFPNEIEAKAFLIFQYWDNKNHDVPMPSRKIMDSLANEVLAVAPMHPGIHHYRIHIWNSGSGDKQALNSAARCGQAAPGIAHMWHMPGHTFSALKRYDDAAWQQEASARVDHAYMIAARIMPDQIHNFAHNNDWLAKDLGYIGRVHDAVDLSKNMIELPRLGSRDSKSYELGRERLVELLLQFEMWDDMLALESTMYLSPRENAVDEVRRLRALGIAAFGKHDRAKADAQIAAIEASLKKAREERIAAADAAETKAKEEKKVEDDIAKDMGKAMRSFASRITITESMLAELRAYRAIADGRKDEAKAQLAKARDISTERQARLWLVLDDKAKAEKLAREATSKDDKQVQPLANLASVLWQIGKKDDAVATFKKVRVLSSSLDLDVPAFSRLAPIAQDQNLSADWREQQPARADSGVRPPLDSLGPFRWHPYGAPAWNLTDRDGKPHALADFAGKPVLVVFYLGSGCAGCIEQLNAFAPVTKEFADAGISIVAVGTENAEGLHKTFDKVKDGATFPFPILADPQHAAFKAYRAYDDFENFPLHGTFLVDGAGQVRWQDISYKPFRDTKWLLGECHRLLSVPAGNKETSSLQ